MGHLVESWGAVRRRYISTALALSKAVEELDILRSRLRVNPCKMSEEDLAKLGQQARFLTGRAVKLLKAQAERLEGLEKELSDILDRIGEAKKAGGCPSKCSGRSGKKCPGKR
ncbi:MAG TPA: hypothetical protein ENJ77_01065 [Candidatus Moranbacteria bacterium]|nr:hypothetical protein [Candidatus Moranbacteria bacterium]